MPDIIRLKAVVMKVVRHVMSRVPGPDFICRVTFLSGSMPPMRAFSIARSKNTGCRYDEVGLSADNSDRADRL